MLVYIGQVAAEEFNDLIDEQKDEEDEEDVPLVFLDLTKNSSSIGKVVSFKVNQHSLWEEVLSRLHYTLSRV